MIGFLRFVGILNAGVWLGAGIFFTLGVGPAVFSREMGELLGTNHQWFSGMIAQILIGRYFDLQFICGTVALLHVLAEWLYLGKVPQRFWLGLLATLVALGLIGGFVFQPRLKQWHTVKYSKQVSVEQRELASQSFKTWHGLSQAVNLFLLLGLAAYLWRVSTPIDPPRFVSTAKFRS